MSRLRVALIGAGRAGSVHAGNLVDYAARAEIVAVVDERREAAEALGPPVALDEALERADAVVISAPTFTHRDLAVRAAEAGKHVFCEKPMALTVAECDEMISAAEGAAVVLQVGFMRRFSPEFVEARRRIEAGDVGEPMVVKSLTRGPGLPPPWAWDLERSNGMLAEVNSHDFDCVRWLAGSEIERVYAEVTHLKGRDRGVDADDFYDNGVVSLRFESGAIGTIDGTCPADYGYDARTEIVCSEGLLVIGDLRGQAIMEVRDRDVGTVTPLHRTWPDRFRDAYRAEMRSFVDSALSGTAPAVTGADGRAAVAAVRAANRSWQEGRPVEVAEEAAA
jgi:myo-inositol 2-dehydrogenase/D-chiro-inositol 1-dehydrogenase/scyllo-inositol 2-dehydrogenase (NAD+)